MVFALLGRPSLIGVLHQKVSNKVLGLLRNIGPLRIGEIVLAFNNLLKKTCLSRAQEWRESTEQDICNDTTTPHIHRLIVTTLSSNDLRSWHDKIHTKQKP